MSLDFRKRIADSGLRIARALSRASGYSLGAALLLLGAYHPAAADAAPPTLRVCADPNNLPFSNEREQGFENALAEIVADELGRTVSYTWRPQRRGFIRNTLNAEVCDLVIGLPAQFEMAQTTAPYYRSTYVFVTRAADEIPIRAFDDPRLKDLRIGVHAIGDDYSNVPPAQALAQHGLIGNVHGYSIYGDYSLPDPPRALIDAVASNEIDVAIAWGPLAGYFAQRTSVPLTITRVERSTERLPQMTFAISMGVRREDQAFKTQIERVLERRRTDIEDTLVRYGVPLVDDNARIARRAEK